MLYKVLVVHIFILILEIACLPPAVFRLVDTAVSIIIMCFFPISKGSIIVIAYMWVMKTIIEPTNFREAPNGTGPEPHSTKGCLCVGVLVRNAPACLLTAVD
jgi:hypothetical protein